MTSKKITLSCFRAGIRNSIRNSNHWFLIFLEGFHKNLTQNPNFGQRILTDLTPCPRINKNTLCKKCDFHFLNFRALNIYLCGKIHQIWYRLFFRLKKTYREILVLIFPFIISFLSLKVVSQFWHFFSTIGTLADSAKRARAAAAGHVLSISAISTATQQ